MSHSVTNYQKHSKSERRAGTKYIGYEINLLNPASHYMGHRI